ncbi:MAG: NAD(P)-dependent dehydrogenase (short-subunit alcohol dehydrogenase family) [Phenylobacterium sp.]|jgi:NAD(P)-dependent dehydrogenase (short-subunit alcohol dehydrogenase family)
MNDKQWDFNRQTTADQVVAGLDLKGKVVLITGANKGLGYETARALASAGAKVLLSCRNLEAGAQAVAKIKLNHSHAQVERVLLDLASLSSVRTLCQALSERPDIPQLDVLICNAGSMLSKNGETEEGFEQTIGVCHIGHFYLTKLLMPLLQAAPAPRVVMVSSNGHKTPKTLDFSTLGLPQKNSEYTSMEAYGQAKLCNILMAKELQHRYGNSGLTACAMDPGMVVTDMATKSNSAMIRFIFKWLGFLIKGPDQGAATIVLCAIASNAEKIAAGYFINCQPKACSAEASNPAVAKQLWALSEQWIGDVETNYAQSQ